MEPTREQLQKDILEILYQKSLQKPIWVSSAEIFWSINNIKVTERSVKDVLDWLVKNDLVLCQADKYQISKREFMDMSRRKGIERTEIEDSQDVSINRPTPMMSGAMDTSQHWDYMVQREHSSSVFYAIIALIALLISGTFIGVLVYNSCVRTNNKYIELTTLPDSLNIGSIHVLEPGHVKDSYTVNRNFRTLYNSLVSQQSVNKEVLELAKAQQHQINQLTMVVKQQSTQIEEMEKERRVYTWMTASVLLVLSLLLVCRFGRRN